MNHSKKMNSTKKIKPAKKDLVEKVNLVEIFDKSEGLLYIGKDNIKQARELLEQLEKTNPSFIDYWENKSKVIEIITENSIYQFAKGESDQGMLISELYEKLRTEFRKMEEIHEKKDSSRRSYIIDHMG